jgi:HSP20 family protein
MVIDFNTLYNFPSRFDGVLDGFFKSPTATNRRTAYPPLNLSNDEDAIYVRAEIPGVALEDVELILTNKSLILKGERRAPEGKLFRQERPAGVFHRVVNIGIPVERDKVTAAMVDGILTVTLPKAEEVKPRTISINVQ